MKRLGIIIAWVLISTFLFNVTAYAAVTAEKPLTAEDLMKINELEKAEGAAAGLKLAAIGLAVGGGLSLVVGIMSPSGSGIGVVLALLSGAGAWWFWDQSRKNEKKAKKLRQELEGRALLNLQNKGDKLCLRIRMPSFEVDSQTGQLQWNLINYSF